MRMLERSIVLVKDKQPRRTALRRGRLRDELGRQNEAEVGNVHCLYSVRKALLLRGASAEFCPGRLAGAASGARGPAPAVRGRTRSPYCFRSRNGLFTFHRLAPL